MHITISLRHSSPRRFSLSSAHIRTDVANDARPPAAKDSIPGIGEGARREFINRSRDVSAAFSTSHVLERRRLRHLRRFPPVTRARVRSRMCESRRSGRSRASCPKFRAWNFEAREPNAPLGKCWPARMSARGRVSSRPQRDSRRNR